MDNSTLNTDTEAGETTTKAHAIFIVEDDEAIGNLLIQVILSETSHRVMVATNAFQALTKLKQAQPQLFLIDYQLPGMNGIELYDRLRQMPELEHIPILLMSAYPPAEAIRERGLETIKKPFELEDLLQTLRKHLE